MVPDPLLIGRPDRAAWLPRARLPLALLAILAGVGAALVPGVLSLAVLGVGATMVGLLKPQWLLTALVVGAFTFDFLVSKGLLPGAARWLPEAAIVLLAIRLALTRLARPLPLRGAGMVDLAVALLIVAAGLGIAVGREHAITTALGLRGWFVLIGLFYVLVNDEALLPVTGRLWWILWALVAVQPVPVFLQWYFSACRNC